MNSARLCLLKSVSRRWGVVPGSGRNWAEKCKRKAFHWQFKSRSVMATQVTAELGFYFCDFCSWFEVESGFGGALSPAQEEAGVVGLHGQPQDHLSPQDLWDHESSSGGVRSPCHHLLAAQWSHREWRWCGGGRLRRDCQWQRRRWRQSEFPNWFVISPPDFIATY